MSLSSKVIFTFVTLILVSACGGKSKPDRANEPVAPSETAVAQAAAADSGPIAPTDPVDPSTETATTTATAESPTNQTGAADSEEVPYAETNTEYIGDVAQQVINQKTEVAAKPQTQATSTLKAVAAEKALGWLKNGNTRFVKRRVRADGQGPADRTRLLSGQNPHAIVYTCSDSRVPPEIIFDQKLGEIFVVRTESLKASAEVITSLEKGVALGAQLLVLLSHEDCSAGDFNFSEVEKLGSIKIQPASYDLKTGVVKFN